MLASCRSLFFALFLATAATSFAADDKPTACVWKIEGAGGTTVYLAGSVHLLREDDHPLPAAYETAYQDSARIYFEVDMSELMADQAKMLQMSMLKDGKTLKEVVDEKTYDRVQAYFKKRGIGGPLFESMNPGHLAMNIAALEATLTGAMPQFGVEMTFDSRAREDGKPVKGLETAEFQMELFTKFTPEEATHFLNVTLDEIDESPDMLAKMIDVWKAGDTEALDKMINDSFEENDAVADLLLYDRNANWIPAIVEEIKKTEGNTMIIVGAGHLVGEKSVIDLLAKKGYKAEQL